MEDYSEPDDFQSEGDNNYCQVLSYLGSSPRCRLDLTELSDTNQQEIPLSSAPVFIFEKLFSPKKFKVIAQLLNWSWSRNVYLFAYFQRHCYKLLPNVQFIQFCGQNKLNWDINLPMSVVSLSKFWMQVWQAKFQISTSSKSSLIKRNDFLIISITFFLYLNIFKRNKILMLFKSLFLRLLISQ